jgi:transketolase
VPCSTCSLAQSAENPRDHHRHAPVKVAIEAGIRHGLGRVIGSDGIFVGMTGFGASAPYKDLYRHFGITAGGAAAAALAVLARDQG